jgi:hypothetical protein
MVTHDRAWRPLLGVALAMAACGTWLVVANAQEPEDPIEAALRATVPGEEPLYVVSLRLVFGFAREGEDPPERGYPGVDEKNEFARSVFVDDEALAKVADPEDRLDVRVTPIYTCVCGPITKGEVRVGQPGAQWTMVCTVTPSDDGGLSVYQVIDTNCLYHRQRDSYLGPDGVWLPGLESIGKHKPGVGRCSGRSESGPLGAFSMSYYMMVEPAWPVAGP